MNMRALCADRNFKRLIFEEFWSLYNESCWLSVYGEDVDCKFSEGDTICQWCAVGCYGCLSPFTFDPLPAKSIENLYTRILKSKN